MPLRDFALLMLVCLIWAGHNVVSKLVLSDMNIPPLFYAMARYGCVSIVVWPWLLPLRAPLWRMVTISALMGGIGFACFFIGLKYSTPSAAAIVLQVGIPATTVLSVLVLGEVIRWRRRLGIILTIAGVLIVMWQPGAFVPSFGLLLIACSGLAGAIGVIMMKQMEGVQPMHYQAWAAAVSLPMMAAATGLFEAGQIDSVVRAGWKFWAALFFSVVLVSILSHNIYFRLVQRHDANLVAPLMLLNPLFAIILGVWITGDPFDLRMLIGSVIALAGVLIITLRPNAVLPRANLLWNKLRGG